MSMIKGSHNSWKAKLDKSQALNAYQLMHHYKWTCARVAEHYKVHRSTMISLRRGQSWAWLTEHNKKKEV